MNSNSLDIFKTAPIKTAVLKNALPAMAAMLLVLLYNLADTFFIGMTHDALQVAAVSLATPVFLLFMSVGNIFGIGGTTAISRSYGEGNFERAEKISSFCMWSSVVIGIIMAVIFIVFSKPILYLVGASDETYELAKSYLNIVCFSGPCVLISSCFSNIIRAEGKALVAMSGSSIGNILNMVLDPIMILYFGWEIRGAAIATVVGNVVSALIYLIYLLYGRSKLSISLKKFDMSKNTCKSVFSIGIPASLGSMLMSVSSIVLNASMSKYGDMSVAAIGVTSKITMITAMITLGIGQGVQPILSYCIGAKLKDRYRGVFRFSALFSFAISFILTLVCFVWLKGIVGAFLSEKEAMDKAIAFTRIYLTTSMIFGVYYLLVNAIQATGNSKYALIVTISRQGLVFIPMMFVFGAIWGQMGLVVAQPVADVVSFVIAIILYIRSIRKF